MNIASNPGRTLAAAPMRSAWRPTLLALLLLAELLPGNAGAAGACSINAHGKPAYDRVTQKVQEKLRNIQQFDFEPYEKIRISLEAGCVLALHGRFIFKKARNQKAGVYDAEVTPKPSAPGGIKILKLRISNP